MICSGNSPFTWEKKGEVFQVWFACSQLGTKKKKMFAILLVLKIKVSAFNFFFEEYHIKYSPLQPSYTTDKPTTLLNAAAGEAIKPMLIYPLRTEHKSVLKVTTKYFIKS